LRKIEKRNRESEKIRASGCGEPLRGWKMRDNGERSGLYLNFSSSES
jgi:hypothetical protein